MDIEELKVQYFVNQQRQKDHLAAALESRSAVVVVEEPPADVSSPTSENNASAPPSELQATPQQRWQIERRELFDKIDDLKRQVQIEKGAAKVDKLGKVDQSEEIDRLRGQVERFRIEATRVKGSLWAQRAQFGRATTERDDMITELLTVNQQLQASGNYLTDEQLEGISQMKEAFESLQSEHGELLEELERARNERSSAVRNCNEMRTYYEDREQKLTHRIGEQEIVQAAMYEKLESLKEGLVPPVIRQDIASQTELDVVMLDAATSPEPEEVPEAEELPEEKVELPQEEEEDEDEDEEKEAAAADDEEQLPQLEIITLVEPEVPPSIAMRPVTHSTSTQTDPFDEAQEIRRRHSTSAMLNSLETLDAIMKIETFPAKEVAEPAITQPERIRFVKKKIVPPKLWKLPEPFVMIDESDLADTLPPVPTDKEHEQEPEEKEREKEDQAKEVPPLQETDDPLMAEQMALLDVPPVPSPPPSSVEYTATATFLAPPGIGIGGDNKMSMPRHGTDPLRPTSPSTERMGQRQTPSAPAQLQFTVPPPLVRQKKTGSLEGLLAAAEAEQREETTSRQTSGDLALLSPLPPTPRFIPPPLVRQQRMASLEQLLSGQHDPPDSVEDQTDQNPLHLAAEDEDEDEDEGEDDDLDDTEEHEAGFEIILPPSSVSHHLPAPPPYTASPLTRHPFRQGHRDGKTFDFPSAHRKKQPHKSLILKGKERDARGGGGGGGGEKNSPPRPLPKEPAGIRSPRVDPRRNRVRSYLKGQIQLSPMMIESAVEGVHPKEEEEDEEEDGISRRGEQAERTDSLHRHSGTDPALTPKKEREKVAGGGGHTVISAVSGTVMKQLLEIMEKEELEELIQTPRNYGNYYRRKEKEKGTVPAKSISVTPRNGPMLPLIETRRLQNM
jgi:hypothetical protein